MVRLAVRKAPSRSKSYETRQNQRANLRSLSARNSVKARARAKTAVASVETARLKTLTSALSDFIKIRRDAYGVSDPVAKKLQAINKSIERELRKKIVINMSLAKNLNMLTPTLRGVSNVPAGLKNQIQSVKTFLKTHAQTEVVRFNTQMKKILTPMVSELKRLESDLQREVKKAHTMGVEPRVNPILKQKFATLLRRFMLFKTSWVKNLNKLKIHSPKSAQGSIDQIKRLLDEKQREFNRNLTILKRYAKSTRSTAGKKIYQIFSPQFLRALEMKWNYLNREAAQFKRNFPRYFDQLKTAKQF